MPKLYFKYGVMGSSKAAQALITKYNYEENGLQVWPIKPSADTRDGADILRSHIVTQGQQVMLGGNDSYIAMRHRCWVRGIRENKTI